MDLTGTVVLITTAGHANGIGAGIVTVDSGMTAALIESMANPNRVTRLQIAGPCGSATVTFR